MVEHQFSKLMAGVRFSHPAHELCAKHPQHTRRHTHFVYLILERVFGHLSAVGACSLPHYSTSHNNSTYCVEYKSGGKTY